MRWLLVEAPYQGPIWLIVALVAGGVVAALHGVFAGVASTPRGEPVPLEGSWRVDVDDAGDGCCMAVLLVSLAVLVGLALVAAP